MLFFKPMKNKGSSFDEKTEPLSTYTIEMNDW